MSEMSGGPGYWQASDGLWYPPDSHPDEGYRAQWAAVQQHGAVIPGAGAQSGGGYPIRLTVQREERIANWRALVHIFMAIPHLIIISLLGIASYVVAIVSWFVILFTGRMPASFHGFITGTYRWFHRTFGFMLLMTERYPDFELDTDPVDRSDYPIRFDADYESGPRNRLTVFFRIFMIIPHAIVLAIIQYAMYVVYILAWFGVLFTGRIPGGLANFMIGVGRWNARYYGYALLLTDEYPPFSLD